MHSYFIKIEVLEGEEGDRVDSAKSVQATTGRIHVRTRDEAEELMGILSRALTGVQALTERRELKAK